MKKSNLWLLAGLAWWEKQSLAGIKFSNIKLHKFIFMPQAVTTNLERDTNVKHQDSNQNKKSSEPSMES